MDLKKFFWLLILLFFLYFFITKGLPLFLALILALVLEPIVQFLRRFLSIQRHWSSTLVSILFTLFVLVTLFILIIFSINEALDLAHYLSEAVLSFSNKIDHVQQGLIIGIIQDFLKVFESLAGIILNFSLDIVTLVPTMILEFLVFFIAFYVFSFNLPNIKESFFSLFHEGSHPKVRIIYTELYNGIIGFIRGQLIISLCIFILVSLGFFILGLNFPLGLAFIIAIIDFLPIIGSGLVFIPLAFYNFVTGKTLFALGLLTIYILASLIRRVMEPKILSQAMGISLISTLVSMYIGFKFFGFLGIMLGPMLVVICKALAKVGLIDVTIKL